MFKLSSRKWILLSITILIIGAGWIWITRAEPGSSDEMESSIPYVGFEAPDFSLQTINGELVTLSELRGQPVLLNFWASWCPPCRAEMPEIEDVYNDFRDQGFVVLAVNATNQDNPSLAIAFTEEHNLTFPILLDADGSVSQRYRVHSLPTSFFIDRFGNIQEVIIGGPMAEALLRIRTENLLSDS